MSAEVERIYVGVTTSIDSTGTIIPKEIVWNDGRVFEIEQVISSCPASRVRKGMPGDCFIIRVRGKEKPLFFEKVDERFPGRYFRWFVERSA